jgi:integrase
MTGRGITARGSGSRRHYRARVYHAGQRYSATFKTEAAALAWRAETLDRLQRAEQPTIPPPPTVARKVPAQPSRAPTVKDAAGELYRGMVAGSARTNRGDQYKPSVIRKYELMLRLHVVPRVGGLPVATLSRRDVQRLVDELAAEQSAETARKALVALRVAYRLAERDGVAPGPDPCRGVRAPRGNRERPARFLSPAESERLIAAADELDRQQGRSLAGPLLRLALTTGLRLGELLALRWQDIELDSAKLHVERSLDRHPGEHGEPVYVDPKTERSRRTIPLTRATVDALRRHLLASGRPSPQELVLARPDSRPVDSAMMPRRLLLRACGLAEIAAQLPRFHDLRHSYATAMLAAGVTPHAVAHLLGHASAQLVYERYGHALPDELAGAARRLEALLAAH